MLILIWFYSIFYYATQGLRIVFEDGSRIVVRLSGTGSSGATVRYIAKKSWTPFHKVCNRNLSNAINSTFFPHTIQIVYRFVWKGKRVGLGKPNAWTAHSDCIGNFSVAQIHRSWCTNCHHINCQSVTLLIAIRTHTNTMKPDLHWNQSNESIFVYFSSHLIARTAILNTIL